MATILNNGIDVKVKTDLGEFTLKAGQKTDVRDDVWTSSLNYYDIKNGLEGGSIVVVTPPKPPAPAAPSK